jgi:hypothetical protein
MSSSGKTVSSSPVIRSSRSSIISPWVCKRDSRSVSLSSRSRYLECSPESPSSSARSLMFSRISWAASGVAWPKLPLFFDFGYVLDEICCAIQFKGDVIDPVAIVCVTKPVQAYSPDSHSSMSSV